MANPTTPASLDTYLPDHATAAEARAVIKRSHSLLDVQRELRVPRQHARGIVRALGLEAELPASRFIDCGRGSR